MRSFSLTACQRREPEREPETGGSIPESKLPGCPLIAGLAFDALGPEARAFHLQLRQRPVKTTVHLRRLLNLVHLYGRADVIAAIQRAAEYQTYDAAYVETILLQDRRRCELPSPTSVRPKRQELLEETDFEEPDPADYDRFCEPNEESENE
jgi:hypothetical protein